MTFDDIKGLVMDAGIERGIDGAWIGFEDEMVDFARLVEKRALERFFRRMPDAWLIQDRTTGEPVRLVITEPTDGWLSETYIKTPLFRP